MFAKYRGNLYKLIKDGKIWEIISKRPSSVDDGFVKDGNIFYKAIDDLDLLEEIFDIELFVEYDTHLKNVNKEWKLQFTKEYYTNDTVKLLFGEGILPNWTVEEKSVCSKYISVNDISRAYMIKTDKRTGEMVKEDIDMSKFNEVFEHMRSL